VDTIHAIYENGVFRPTTPVDLPDPCEVTFEPRKVETDPVVPPAQLAKLHEILSHSYETGQTDLAARHDEHQP
jgi:predicted DNA-binding antitoxin AbrB/MazE fold protein